MTKLILEYHLNRVKQKTGRGLISVIKFYQSNHCGFSFNLFLVLFY